MPIYVYKNVNTGETFELEQRITEDALIVHPETGDPVKRLIQPVGIAFKGSGFYVNDSKASSSANGSAAKTDSSKEDTKTEAKTETKPEKTESKASSKEKTTAKATA